MAPLLIIAAAGAVVGAAGEIQKGRAAKAAADYNSRMLQMQAAYARQKAAEDERRFLIGARKQIGGIRANFGASGVTMEGSPMEVMEESIRTASLDALTIRHQGELQARQMENEIKLQTFKGKQAITDSYYGAAGSLLGGAGKAYDYSQYSRSSGVSDSGGASGGSAYNYNSSNSASKNIA